MIRFFDIIVKSLAPNKRKLNLVDLGIGDNSVKVVGKILKNNPHFAILDLRKNFITNTGIKSLAKSLIQNDSIVHLELGCNQISCEGAISLFTMLKR